MYKVEGEFMIEESRRKEILRVAFDTLNDKVFFSEQLPEGGDLLFRVFMPLLFLDKEASERLEVREPAVFYEYLSEAGPMSINGYPTFSSLRMFNEEEYVFFVQSLEDQQMMIQKMLELGGV